MNRRVAQFDIFFSQYLDEQGQVVADHELLSDWSWLTRCYQAMVLTRQFDQKAVALQRTGQLGTYPSCLGAEAVAVGAGRALQAEDVHVPYYRDQGTQLLRGVSMEEILLYWGGDERGSDYQAPGAREDLPNCVPIATQLSHAAGVAVAIKYRRQPRAVLVTCGDGATSRGDFHEALNLAGVWQLPLVVLINNNQWAISVPRELQSASATLAQKAIAAGIPGEQVDGNDVVAVYHRVDQALRRARAGKGATVIEALSYRLSDHTTADDASRYRDREELGVAWARDPVARLQRYLHQHQHWDEEREQALVADCRQRIQREVDRYLAHEAEPATAMFDYLYAELPVASSDQYEHVAGKAGVQARVPKGDHYDHD